MKIIPPDPQKIKLLAQNVNSLTEKVNEINDLIFQLIVNDLFENYPELEKFSFVGYTPGYCDGEECTFSLNTYQPTINNEEDGESFSNEVNKALARVVPIYLNILPDDFYNSHYGTNFKITATRESVEVEDYDCGY